MTTHTYRSRLWVRRRGAAALLLAAGIGAPLPPAGHTLAAGPRTAAMRPIMRLSAGTPRALPAGLEAVRWAPAPNVTAPATTIWTQQDEITRPGNLGQSVAISGNTAIVGVPSINLAYVFVRSAGTWTQQATITATGSGPYDDFGSSVALNGNTAIIGAPGRNYSTGTAYVYVRSAGIWTQQAVVTPAHLPSQAHFGASVALSGYTAVIGEQQYGPLLGAAYVFVRSGTSWIVEAKLTAGDGATGDFFGSSVAVSGGTALIGAYGKNSTTGAAYVFVRNGTIWTQQQEITATDGVANDDFGNSVALSSETALIGATGKNNLAGATYVFTGSGTGSTATWSLQTELAAPSGASGFGGRVSLSGATALIGANNTQGKGAAYVFVPSGTTWTQQAELTASDAALRDEFGSAVALSGSTAIIGAPRKQTAYLFVGS